MSIETKRNSEAVSELLQSMVRVTLVISIIAVISSFAVYCVFWYQYKPMRSLPHELSTMTVENHGLSESLILYFDASSMGLDGRPFTDGNYLLTVDTSTDIISAERLPAQGQQHEIQGNGYTSHYAMTPLNTVGQRFQMSFAGIPIATGGHYIVRDESGIQVAVVTDSEGIDLHDFIITPEGNYLYLAAQTLPMYRDSTLTCLPHCGLLGQSVVEVTSSGQELYRYHLLEYYNRDDFIMDDMLIWENGISMI